MSTMPRWPKRRATPEAVEEQFAWSVSTLNALMADIAEVFERMARDSDNGYRSPAGSEGRGGKYGDDGANNGPVPRAAMRGSERPDAVHLRFQAFLNGVPALSSLVQSLAGHARFLVAMDAKDAKLLVEQKQPGRGSECANQNCKRWVENTTNDPVRAGRCSTCYKYRQRNNGEDRPKDLVEAPAYREAG